MQYHHLQSRFRWHGFLVLLVFWAHTLLGLAMPATATIPSSPTATVNDSERAWLAKHHVLRVGGDSHWAPMDFLGADGTRQGVAWDYLHAMEPTLGVRFVPGEPKLWSEIIRDAREKRLDLLGHSEP